MIGEFPWPAAGSLLSGVVAVGFLRFLWPYRTEPGGWFFLGTIACEALWALSYGTALLVFDPVGRWLFEIPIWLGINFIGVFFLAFALEYTGRSSLVRSKAMGGLVGLQALHTLVVATNPLHHLAWSDYHIEPAFAVATVVYTHGPWLFLNVVGVVLAVAAASFILADTFVSYGPLYRTQAAAVAISPVLPGVAFLAWLLQVGPVWQVNLTALTFPVHLAVDGYAFFSRDMFELTPAARRAGERAAIDDLGTAVLILDDDDRVVELNDEAKRVLDADEEMVLGRPLRDYLGSIDSTTETDPISLRTDGTRREYTVATSAIEDDGGNRVGTTLVLQDVTAERRREQRLAVLNRVLRHNLRNDLTVVQGYFDVAGQRIDDEELSALHESAKEKTLGVVDLAEKARDIDQLMDQGADRSEEFEVLPVLEDIATDLLAEYAGDLRFDVPQDLTLVGDPTRVDLVFRNLIENGLEHGGRHPVVEVTFTGLDDETGRATFQVRDDGPGIPDHELAVIDSGEETPLEHGSGLGLWIVEWGTRSLGGQVRYETDDTGTMAILEIPAPAEAT